MQQPDLKSIRDWANEKLATGQEPPWAWYQYMKLRETLDAIIAAQGSTTDSSLQLAAQSGMHLRLVDEDYQQENAQSHHDNLPVNMPM